MLEILTRQTLAMYIIMANRRRAANILDKINERGIERRMFQQMLDES